MRCVRVRVCGAQELRYPGIVLNATMLVLGTAASLLAAYNARIITVTDKFRDGVMMVTGGARKGGGAPQRCKVSARRLTLQEMHA